MSFSSALPRPGCSVSAPGQTSAPHHRLSIIDPDAQHPPARLYPETTRAHAPNLSRRSPFTARRLSARPAYRPPNHHGCRCRIVNPPNKASFEQPGLTLRGSVSCQPEASCAAVARITNDRRRRPPPPSLIASLSLTATTRATMTRTRPLRRPSASGPSQFRTFAVLSSPWRYG